MAISILTAFVFPYIGIPAAIFFFVQAKRLKAAWNTLTLRGEYIHPVLMPDVTQQNNP